MSVQALHPDPSAADSPAGLHEVTAYRCDVATPSVLIVGALELVWVDESLEAVDPTIAFETTHGIVQLGINQPEQSGHRCAVAQVRFVLDHDGPTVFGPYHHSETSGQRTADQSFNEKLIVSRRVAKRQRQNSSVRTKRDRNPWSW